MTVPDEAVEAAAKRIGPAVTARDVVTILTAAAPFIAADAWDEGEDAGYKNCNSDQWGTLTVKNPYRSEQ